MIQRLQVKRNEKGFTLIELLIVIIVLGILAAIVVFAIGSTRKDSVSSACKTNLRSLELSAEAVNTKSGNYGSAGMNDLLASANKGGLLKSLPSTGTDYTLNFVGTPAAPPFTGYSITVTNGSGGLVGGSGIAGCAPAP
jgi:general secretion pathway protein G